MLEVYKNIFDFLFRVYANSIIAQYTNKQYKF